MIIFSGVGTESGRNGVFSLLFLFARAISIFFDRVILSLLSLLSNIDFDSIISLDFTSLFPDFVENNIVSLSISAINVEYINMISINIALHLIPLKLLYNVGRITLFKKNILFIL